MGHCLHEEIEEISTPLAGSTRVSTRVTRQGGLTRLDYRFHVNAYKHLTAKGLPAAVIQLGVKSNPGSCKEALSLSRTDSQLSDGFLPRQPVSIGSDGVRLPIFPTPPQLYFAEYVLSLLRTDMRRSDGFLPRQPVSIGSDGVRLPTFSTPSSSILCCIFTNSLANCLPVSLVAHGLLPSDSVWVYWTTLNLRKECFSNVSSRSLFRSIIRGHFTVVCSVTRSLAMAAGDLAFIQLHCFYPVYNCALIILISPC